MDPIVVVIDSGIQGNLLGKSLINSISFQDENTGSVDLLGHGSACAVVINSLCKSAKFISICILDSEGYTSSEMLLSALTYCLSINCNIINLSLSLLDYGNYEIEELCKKLFEQNKLVISSVRNRHEFSEPAAYQSVLGVRGAIFSSREEFWFNANKTIQIITDISPVFTNSELGDYFIFSGNSKAAAVASGLVAQLIASEKITKIEQIYGVLEIKCLRDSWVEFNIETTLSSYTNAEEIANGLENEYQKIHEVISQVLKHSGEPNKERTLMSAACDLFNAGIMVPQRIMPLLQELEKVYSIKLELRDIKPFMLKSINSIYMMVRGAQHN